MHNTEQVQPNRPNELLKRAFQEKVKKNPAYSLRAASRDLGVTHGYLSLILNGKKRLTFKRAVQFAQFLHMNDLQTEFFLKAIALDSMRDSGGRAYLQNALVQKDSSQSDEFAHLEIDRFRILSEWYHIAILDLTLLAQFKPDPIWVANELGITTEEAKSAVARLERVGLLEVSKNKWTKTSAKLAVPTNHCERAIQDFHNQMIDKAKEALDSSDPNDFAEREISGVTIAINPEKIPEAKKKIEAFKRELLTFMSEGKCTALYQMNIQMFQLNKTRIRKTVKNKREIK